MWKSPLAGSVYFGYNLRVVLWLFGSSNLVRSHQKQVHSPTLTPEPCPLMQMSMRHTCAPPSSKILIWSPNVITASV